MTRPAAVVGTFSGQLLNVLEPDPERIYIHDIAHGLSNLCRWVGQITLFFSVAEHCLKVEEQAPEDATPVERMQALLHDAPEAYLSDVSYPVKFHLPNYRALEAIWWEAIAEAYDLPRTWPVWLEEADRAVALAEADAFAHPNVRRIAYEAYPDTKAANIVFWPGKSGPGYFGAWSPNKARVEWVARWRKLFLEIVEDLDDH